MATIKSCTDLSQSKVLAKILPLESADMYYREVSFSFYKVEAEIPRGWYGLPPKGYYCWSLAALLNVLPYPTLHQQRDEAWGLDVWVEQVKPYSVNNTICEVDACYEMIIKLHELKML